MTKNDASQLILKEFLPYRLSYLDNMIGQELARLYTDDFGITHAEWRVMAVVGRTSGVSAAYVADKTAMDKVAVSRAINNMIENKIISRSFSSEDRRRSILKLSKAGQEIYLKIVPLVQDYEKKLLESLTTSESNSLNNILSKLTNYVDKKA